MTTATRNEAAERLFRDSASGLTDRQFRARLRDALATERRATVERIRLEIRLSAFAANSPGSSAYKEVLAILDEEAAS